MNRRATYDIIIVGAGPAGSATATFLAERGLRVALIDRARFPRPKPCAEYLSPEANRVLARLDVLQELERHEPARLSGMRITSPDGTAFEGRFSRSTPRGFTDVGLALPREVLDTTLLARAVRAGAHDFQGVRCERFTVERDRVEVHMRGTDTRDVLRGDLLVGADGLHSRIARQLGVVRRGWRRRVAFVTHAAHVQGMDTVGEMHVGRGGYAGLAPIGGGVTNVAVVLDDLRPADGSAAQRFERALSWFPRVAARMANATRIGPVRAAGPFAHWTTRASADRLLLVGDAADFYDPFTGEGIHAALHGAELATETVLGALARGRLDARALRPYDRARRRAFGTKWILERLIAQAIAMPALFDRLARRLRQRPTLADLLVSVTGDIMPARAVLSPAFMWQLIR